MENKVKQGKGKGNKKNLTGFDTFTLVDNPPPAGRVDLLAERYDKKLDLWTREPLNVVVEDDDEPVVPPEPVKVDIEKPLVNPLNLIDITEDWSDE